MTVRFTSGKGQKHRISERKGAGEDLRVSRLASSHAAGQWQSQDKTPGLCSPSPGFLLPTSLRRRAESLLCFVVPQSPLWGLHMNSTGKCLPPNPQGKLISNRKMRNSVTLLGTRDLLILTLSTISAHFLVPFCIWSERELWPVSSIH